MNYTVIIYPAPPATRGKEGMGSYTTTPGARVVTIAGARDPGDAANKAKLAPGERCTVVVKGRSFSRAELAPLEETDERFHPLPEVLEAPRV